MQELTRQQNRIVELLAEGYNTIEIADELKISYATVKNQIYLLRQRLDARDKTEVVILYYKNKIKAFEENLKEAKA